MEEKVEIFGEKPQELDVFVHSKVCRWVINLDSYLLSTK